MPCTAITLGKHGHAFVCGRKPKAKAKPCCAEGCDRPAQMLCDVPVEGGGTCDAPCCPVHAWHEGTDKHRCPEHSQTYGADYRKECLARRLYDAMRAIHRQHRAAGQPGMPPARAYFDEKTRAWTPDFRADLMERINRIWKADTTDSKGTKP